MSKWQPPSLKLLLGGTSRKDFAKPQEKVDFSLLSFSELGYPEAF
jgi:hypothetical protein